MTQPWNMAKVRSRQRLTPLKYKPVGPIGPTVVPLADNGGAYVNGVPLSYRAVFSLAVNVPEMGISNAGPDGVKRGDGLIACRKCGYQVCACFRINNWTDGTRHICMCKGASPEIYLLEPHCKAHEHMEHPERFPEAYCAKHKNWKGGHRCHYCAMELVDKHFLRPGSADFVSLAEEVYKILDTPIVITTRADLNVTPQQQENAYKALLNCNPYPVESLTEHESR